MIDLRRALTAGLQEGVYAAGSCEVTQRGAGANMSVDLAMSTHENGIAALVQGDSVTGQALYSVPPHSAVINETISAAHATLPRVDAVIIEIQDNVHDASGANIIRTRVVAGTATSGATLDNARDGSHGGAAIPSNALHVADVLVAGAAGSITNSVIRDRRKFARGAYAEAVKATGTVSLSVTTPTWTIVDSTNLNPRVECSGVPVTVRFVGPITAVAAGVGFKVYVDGVDSGAGQSVVSTAGFDIQTFVWRFTPAAGSHRIALYYSVQSTAGSLGGSGVGGEVIPSKLTVEESVKQLTANNTTTTG